VSDKLATLKAKNSISFKALESGETEVSFIVDKLNYGEKTHIRAALEEAGDALTVAVSKYRKKRSLDANNYLWKLIGELASETNLPDEEVYRGYIKDCGLKKTDEMSDEFYKTVSYVWSQRGIGWFSEKTDFGSREGYSLYTFYYGSSCYNSKQMSRLIDAVVQDCKAVGIETMPPDEVDSLISSWKGKI
jgi:hypothetical protein